MVSVDLFKNKVIRDTSGSEQVIDFDLAQSIYEGLITNGYVKKGILTDKYYEDKNNGTVEIAEEVEDCKDSVIAIIDTIYDSRSTQPENARKNNVQLEFDKKKYDSAEFKALWSRINSKSVYVVEFDESELIKKAVTALDRELRVSKIYFKVERGQMTEIGSREQLKSGESFVREEHDSYAVNVTASSSVKYDLVGKIVAETGLTRRAVAKILAGLEKHIFGQFSDNPEEFIIRAANIINEQKATAIIEHITYDKLTAAFGTEVFTEPDLKKGSLCVNAMEAKRHLYDYVIYDSTKERDFAAELEAHSREVEIYVKLPRGFYISTPVGRYNPDWAIAFYEGMVKHIYFVAETKGDISSMELRKIEEAKAHCAREHFRAISGENVIYDVVDSYDRLWEIVRN